MAAFLSHGVSALGSGIVVYIVPFLFVLTIVVFFHELGHFLVARLAGVKVLTFSIGFGPELIGFNDRHGTRWKLSAVPLGGYVKFFGDESEASTPASASTLDAMSDEEKKLSFHHQKVAPRAAIVVAGPLANFVLAVAIFAGLFMVYGKPSAIARVDEVQASSPAADAGFKTGDVVTAIDGQTVETFADMQQIVSMNADTKLRFTVKRGDGTLSLDATPALTDRKDALGNRQKIGVLGIVHNQAPNDPRATPVGPVEALKLGVNQSWFIVTGTMKFLGTLVSGRGGADQVGGPIRIAQMSGQAASLGFEFLIHLTAALSVSIGLLNLFPVPLLDGGHLLFYAIEALRGKPLSERAQEMSFRIGFALVLMLMLFTTYNDILHLPGQ
jgi:regulator of sigma E protease